MKVEQMMNRTAKSCHPEDSLNKAAQLMWDNSCGAVAVVDAHSKPIGFLTDRDICMAAYTRGKLLQELTSRGRDGEQDRLLQNRRRAGGRDGCDAGQTRSAPAGHRARRHAGRNPLPR